MAHAKYALFCGTALAMLAPPAVAQPAPNARPTGGQVAAGQASIGGNSTLTLITQQSQNAVINWQSYNVGSGQTVQYQQPNAQSFALNRVISAQPSQIAGNIIANGQIAIVNQSGVVFYRGASVNTAGLVVSASGITNQDFMAGRLVFSQAPNPGATISNAGNITIAQAGLAAIVAPQVQNSGTISAQLGRVVLGGAATFALDMNGDGLVALNVTGQVTRVQIGNQSVPALVTNIGTILAPGGTVVLTAAAADGLVQKIISAGGTIAAPTVGSSSGRVLVSGIGGDVEIDGTVSATGPATGSKGGQIEVNSDHNVSVAAGATLDASGDSGGGLVAVGATAAYAASAPVGRATLTAANTSIAAGATVRADATRAGHGGRIAVASFGTTTIGGSVTARGGPAGGDGGDIILQGRAIVTGAWPDTDAQAGLHGMVLSVYQGNTDIVDLSNANCPVSNCVSYTSFFQQASQGTVDVKDGTLEFLAAADSSTGSAINFETTTSGEVIGDILVQSVTDLVAGGITASSVGSILVFGTLSSGAGAMSLTAGLALQPQSGEVITEDEPDRPGPPQSPAGTIIADTLALAAENGDVQLDQPTNQIGTLLASSASGTLNVVNGSALAITGPVSASNVTLTTESGDIVDTGNISATAGNGLIDMSAGGSIDIGGTLTAGTLSGGVYGGAIVLDAQAGAVTETANGVFGQVDAGTLSTQAGGEVDLQGQAGSAPANQISILSGGTAGGNFILTDAANLDVTGGVTAGNGDLLLLEVGTATASSSLTISPGITLTSTGGTIALQADQFSLYGALNAGTGEIAYDIYQQGGTLAVVANGQDTVNGVTYTSNFGTVGLPASANDTLVLGRIPGETSHTGALFIGAHLQGFGAGFSIGLYSTGTILEDFNQDFDTGALINASVFGAAGSLVLLFTPFNQIITLDGFSTGGAFDLYNNAPLTIAGNLEGSSLYLNVQGNVSENAGVAVEATSAAGTLAIESGNGGIFLFGTNSAGTLNTSTNTYSGTVLLSASGGDITETAGDSGIIAAGTLAASATGSISLANTANNVATIAPGTLADGTNLAGLTAGTSLDFDDNQSLALANAVVSGSEVTLDIAGALGQTGGSIVATSSDVSLTAAAMTLGGKVQASGQSVVLDALAGNMTESAGGAIIAGTLSAQAASGSVDLGSLAAAAPVNQVGTLLSGEAAGDFTLTDAANLTVAGAVSAGGSVLFLESGTAGQARTLSLAAGASLTDAGGTIALTADNFALGGGTLNAGTGEADFANFLPGETLTVGGGGGNFAGGSLGALTANQIAFTSTGDLVIAEAISLPAGTLGLFAANAILENGAGGLSASVLAGLAGGDITLDGGNEIAGVAGITSIRGTSLAGLSSTGGALNFIDGGSLAIEAGADVAGSKGVFIVTSGGLTETAGADIASAGTVLLDSTAGSLVLDGAVTGGAVALAASGDIVADGTIEAGTLAAAAGGDLTLGNGGNGITAIDSLTVSAPALATDLTLAGLSASGSISLDDGGALAVGTAASPATISAGAGVTLTATGNLAQVNGTWRAGGNVQVTAATFFAAGTIEAGGALSVASTGDITEATGASLSGDSSVALASTAGNIIQQAGATISSEPTINGAPSATGLITVDAPGTISLAGTLAAGTIELGAAGPVARVDWDNNVIFTGSSLAAGTNNIAATIPFGSQDGLFVSADGVSQTGETTIAALGGSQATVEISLAGSSDLVQFNAANGTASGLIAPQTQLLLDLGATGRATGNIDVAGLNVFHDGRPAVGGGAAALTGLVGGQGGNNAAGVAFSHPTADANYMINGCEIGVAGCGAVTPPPPPVSLLQVALALPVDDPAQDSQIGNGGGPALLNQSEFVVQQIVLRRRDTQDDESDDDLILPNVADQDY